MKAMWHSQRALSQQSNQILKQSTCSCVLCKKLSPCYDSTSCRPQFSYNRQWYAKSVQIHWSYTNVCWIKNVCNLLRNFTFIFLNEIRLYFLFSDKNKIIPVYHVLKKFNGLYLLLKCLKSKPKHYLSLAPTFGCFVHVIFFNQIFQMY